jgi:hypothetical protein
MRKDVLKRPSINAASFVYNIFQIVISNLMPLYDDIHNIVYSYASL